MKLLFWFSIVTILYVYIGYPLLVYLLSLFYKKSIRSKYLYPTLSIIVAAYNEERHIENKILSLLSLDYPQERIEILIGSDGSTDKTEAIVSKYTNEKIRLYCRKIRQGKPSMLNFLVPYAKGDVLVFTDARQILDKKVLKELVKHFIDEKVGSVSSALFYLEGSHDTKTGVGIGLYWDYEKFIRMSESRMGSMLGATGALYAIRKELYPHLPHDLILDDVYIPMKIVEKGFRAIFDSRAKVYDRVFKNAHEEFLRKTRTLAGNFQLFVYLRGLFNPFKGKISLQFISHKFLRLLVPFFLIFIFVSNLFVLKTNFYKAFLVLQVIFYTLAFLGRLIKRKNFLLDVPYMFCVLNLAALVGLYKFVTGKQDILWQKAGDVSKGENLYEKAICS